jgi:hypothetical protein
MRKQVACVAGALVFLGGCGANNADVVAVRTVAKRWLDASVTGDGSTYCELLAPSLRRRVDATARQLGSHVTCAESQSTHPPGIRTNQLCQIATERRQAAVGLRIDSGTIAGSKATVRYSWRAPTPPPPGPSVTRPVDRRLHATVTLVQLKGQWRVS